MLSGNSNTSTAFTDVGSGLARPVDAVRVVLNRHGSSRSVVHIQPCTRCSTSRIRQKDVASRRVAIAARVLRDEVSVRVVWRSVSKILDAVVDAIDGLPPAVALQQQRGTPSARSSVGSVTTISLVNIPMTPAKAAPKIQFL